MSALIRAAAVAALISAIGALETEKPPAAPVVEAARPTGLDGLPAYCGARTLPEGASCIPLPPPGASVDAELPLRPQPSLADISGRIAAEQDRIPRRPDRPVSLGAYRFPIESARKAPHVLSGSLSDATTELSSNPLDPAHSGLELQAIRGEPVTLMALEEQQGQAEVIFVGTLIGTTVVTAHSVREAGGTRRYLVIHGHLDRPGTRVAPGVLLSPGEVVGYAGDSGSPGVFQLYLDVRKLREHVDLRTLDPRRINEPATSIACDLRNVLPLADSTAPPP